MFDKKRFFKAVKAGDVAAMEKIIARNPSIVHEYDGGYSAPLYHAMRGGAATAAAFEKLLLSGVTPSNYAHSDWNGVQAAAWCGRADIVERFINMIPDLRDFKSPDKETPLIVAVMAGQDAVVKYLLSIGADVTPRDRRERTAYDHALVGGKVSVIELLKPYHDAAVEKQREILRLPASAQNGEGWEMLSPVRIAHVVTDTQTGYRLTDVYNFAARERLRICHNLETRADTIETTPFASMPETAMLQLAADALTQAGGAPQFKDPISFAKHPLTPLKR